MKRLVRLQIMLDESELYALDEWRFSQKMPSRAATVRHLLRMALRIDMSEEEFAVEPRGVASKQIGILASELDPDHNAAAKSD